MKVKIEKGMDINNVGPRFQFLFNELIKEFGVVSVSNITMYFDVYIGEDIKLDTKNEVITLELARNHSTTKEVKQMDGD